MNTVSYEYTGYGESHGRLATEQSVYNDINAVFLYLTKNLRIPESRIILYGRSIGSGPTCWLAERHEVAGVILHSAIMSTVRVVLKTKWTLPIDKFPNINRMENIKCPVFVIHGLED